MPFSLLKKLFASGPKPPDYDQIVWGTNKDKFRALLERVQQLTAGGDQILILAWFPKTLNELDFLLTNMNIPFANGVSQMENQLVVIESAEKYLDHLPQTNRYTASIHVWVAEHYPLHTSELALFEKLATEIPNAKPIIFASMDEQLFTAFGGTRIKELMIKMGFSEEESIQHNMVKQSIVRAQQKVAEQVISEQKANSDEAWFAANFRTKI